MKWVFSPSLHDVINYTRRLPKPLSALNMSPENIKINVDIHKTSQISPDDLQHRSWRARCSDL